MKPVRCKSCGVAEWRHVCASNKSYAASKRRVNEDKGAGLSGVKKAAEGGKAGGDAGVLQPEVCKGTKQRWSRQAYNAYMRVYMAVRRGRAEWWPRRVSG